MSKITLKVVEEIEKRLDWAKAGSDFKDTLLNMATALVEDDEAKAKLSIKHTVPNCKAKINKFLAGAVKGSDTKLVQCDINGVPGTAVWEKFETVKNKDKVCAFFKIDGKRAFYSIIAPNPGVADEAAYNWCVSTLVDMAAETMYRKEDK